MKTGQLFLLLALTAVVACGGTGGSSASTGGGGGAGGGSSCPVGDIPSACPSPAPTYSKDVEPIFEKKCNLCHGPGGEAKDLPLTTWAEIEKIRGGCLDQIYTCRMPPAKTVTLSSEERATLLAWFVCDAPND